MSANRQSKQPAVVASAEMPRSIGRGSGNGTLKELSEAITKCLKRLKVADGDWRRRRFLISQTPAEPKPAPRPVLVPVDPWSQL